ncbi:hypothetical protein Bsp3421_001138 [Burkholderia sp. FERM BP-3421]|uniref:hypothetical protein n=1 Tax=Burkholderia sp. FERM BP-3421 TaxID=1494466 RepID=UPI00235F8649|nr:hypothetical protein [Burkholderia sp. FERM BP-3421]WDD91233.1 hypothetical protein Bsp3421_001138 [Burkholderia sp. FERM BP-3421]
MHDSTTADEPHCADAQDAAMDKRYNALPLPEQLSLRRQAVEDVLAHPEWTLQESVRHPKRTMRLTSAEMAKLAGGRSRISNRGAATAPCRP